MLSLIAYALCQWGSIRFYKEDFENLNMLNKKKVRDGLNIVSGLRMSALLL